MGITSRFQEGEKSSVTDRKGETMRKEELSFLLYSNNKTFPPKGVKKKKENWKGRKGKPKGPLLPSGKERRHS